MTLLRRAKAVLRDAPIAGPLWGRFRAWRVRFSGTSSYWEHRYRGGGNSGPGSYNRLAEFKADFLNRFVDEKQVASVVEHGCGDGAQLSLARYPHYTGIDISPAAVEICSALYTEDASKRFLLLDAAEPCPIADLALSLDVVFHLVEDALFEAYMRHLFDSAVRFVIIYSSNIDQHWTGNHVRHRRFTKWIEENKPEWCLHSTVKNIYPCDPDDPEQTSFSDFYVFARRAEPNKQ